MELNSSRCAVTDGRDARYATLDGVRGIAAVLVAIFHFQQRLGLPVVNGYLAVDLFFVLSGFVLARIYEPRFADGLGPFKFAAQRWLRFYPLYAVGFAFGTACLFFAPPPELSNLTPASKTTAILFGALMLPTPFSSALFPLNGAAWSLFFELAVNLLFAAFLWRLRKSALVLAMAPALLFLCLTAGEPLYLNIGWRWTDFIAGSARTVFSFTAGILICRVLANSGRRKSAIGLLVPVVAAAPMIVTGRHPEAWELATVAIFFPLVVALGATVEPPEVGRRAMLWLGALSFPLYAIQWPLAALLAPWLRSLSFWAAATVFLTITVALASIARSLIDEPVQRALRRFVGILSARHASRVHSRARLAL
jgi:peptidoglycan/LPS O-acetylase OafA/YrhL